MQRLRQALDARTGDEMTAYAEGYTQGCEDTLEPECSQDPLATIKTYVAEVLRHDEAATPADNWDDPDAVVDTEEEYLADVALISHYRTAAPALARMVERLAEGLRQTPCVCGDPLVCDPDDCPRCVALADAAALLPQQAIQDGGVQ